MRAFQITHICVILLISFFAFLSCTEKTQDPLTPEKTETDLRREAELLRLMRLHRNAPECMVKTYPESDIIPPTPPEPIHREKMAELLALRQRYEGTVLEDNFRILRDLIDSEIYKTYLRETFRRMPQFDTLDEFWRMTMMPIPTETYRPLFDGFLENPEVEDFAYLHQRILEGKGALTLYQGLSIFCARDPGDPPNIPKIQQPQHLIDGPFIDTPLHEFTEKTLEKWIFDNGLGENAYNAFEARYTDFIQEASENDKKKIRGFFNTYGVDEGLILLALQAPDLTGLLLWYAFDEAMFIAWVNDS
jgi:hypothetical protein